MERMIRRSLLLILAVTVAACAPQPESPGVEPENGPRDEPQQQQQEDVDQDIQNFENQVEEALRESEQELEEIGSDIRSESEDAWDELSEQAENAWDGIRSEVEALTAEENGRTLETTREDAAENLAEVHGETVKLKLQSVTEASQFREVATEELEQLESELDEIERGIRTAPADPEVVREQQPIDVETVREHRETVRELRRDVQELARTPDELEDEQEDKAEEIGELAREVRHAKYLLDWQDGEGLRGTPGA